MNYVSPVPTLEQKKDASFAVALEQFKARHGIISIKALDKFAARHGVSTGAEIPDGGSDSSGGTQPDNTPKPILKVGSDFDETTRVHMYLAQRLAQSEDGKTYLRRSNGRRRAGRPSFYWLIRQDDLPKKFTADNDDEALEIANRWTLPELVGVNGRD